MSAFRSIPFLSCLSHPSPLLLCSLTGPSFLRAQSHCVAGAVRSCVAGAVRSNGQLSNSTFPVLCAPRGPLRIECCNDGGVSVGSICEFDGGTVGAHSAAFSCSLDPWAARMRFHMCGRKQVCCRRRPVTEVLRSGGPLADGITTLCFRTCSGPNAPRTEPWTCVPWVHAVVTSFGNQLNH